MTSLEKNKQIVYNTAYPHLALIGFRNAAFLASCMVAQSMLESGMYASNVFRTNNNAFGYKRYPGSAYQLGAGVMSPEGDAYARYASLAMSTKEVAAWIGRRKTKFSSVTSTDQYVSVLKSEGYFGGSQKSYADIVRRYIKTVTQNPIALSFIGILLLTGAVVAFTTLKYYNAV